MTLMEGRRDQYPENMIGKSYYRDTGCPGGCDSSLNCPLPFCVEERPSHSEHIVTRNTEIRELKVDGCDMLTLTIHFNLSNRQVHRILQLRGGAK